LADFVMTERGTVALIDRGQVLKVRRADVQVLDTEAVHGSMAYAAGAQTLYWTSGGQARFAPMR
jgi:hypothetical protein